MVHGLGIVAKRLGRRTPDDYIDGGDPPPESAYDHYTIEEYAERLEEVREAIGTKQFHLYGQSWGGRLTLKYCRIPTTSRR
ncbi:alpha/beta fold hydrolase [Natronobacterium haloterrestre]|uniref:alpha/beta fold hydrolase n=1 Tax=Natronobacterium haloterrestre TaxID=148448 RepID=UPI001FDF8CB5|nr:alpha/beta fold hydrolase [Halobiforma haloterrestris]